MTVALATVSEGNIGSAARDASAKRIRKLMEDMSNNSLNLGGELKKVRETFPTIGSGSKSEHRPGWYDWAEKETGLTSDWVTRLITVFEKFGYLLERNQKLPSVNVLDFLALETVSKEARDDVLGRIADGEKIGRPKAREIVDKHRLPKPKEANAQAKEEGRPVLASDGYIYFGTSPEKAKEGEDRRAMVYGVRRALDHLGGIQLTGNQFLSYAEPHQLWDREEAKVIKRALRWLISLDEAWEKWEPNS